MIHAAGRDGVCWATQPLAGKADDRALARLVGEALLTFSVDGSAVAVHRAW